MTKGPGFVGSPLSSASFAPLFRMGGASPHFRPSPPCMARAGAQTRKAATAAEDSRTGVAIRVSEPPGSRGLADAPRPVPRNTPGAGVDRVLLDRWRGVYDCRT